MGLLPNIPEKDKEPITELKRQKAILFKSSIYLYNPFTLCISTYDMFENGFSYSVLKHDLNSLIKNANFVYMTKGAREINEDEFKDFVNQITALQEQSHLIKPLTPFEDFVNSILSGYGLKPNKSLS